MKTTQKIPYIQGFRALCVLLVLLFHIDKSWLPGGFLGVDAFFAISGYVITRMLFRQQVQGRFSLKKFYYSRITKLLPPLFAVLTLTVVAFSFLYTAGDRNNVYFSSLSAALSFSNFYFYLGSGYFSESSIYKPLLHTWSLGVEEQFYLLWPIVFLAFSNKKWFGYKTFFLVAITGAVVSSLFFYLYFDLVFYMMPFRAYQLLFGVAFAICTLKLISSSTQMHIYRTILSTIPIIIIIFAILTQHNGGNQFYLQLCTSFIVAYACFLSDSINNVSTTSEKRSSFFVINYILESRIAQYLGDRSYHIYLVHWPIITAAHVQYSELLEISFLFKFVIGIVCLVIAELIYLLFSKNREFDLRKKSLTLFLFLFSCAPAIHLFATHHSADVTNENKHLNLSKKLKSELDAEVRGLECHIGVRPLEIDQSMRQVSKCISPNKKNILVIGDSYSRSVFLALKQISQNFELNIIRVYIAGCPPYFGNDPSDLKRLSEVRSCKRFNSYPWQLIHRKIQETKDITALIVAGNWQARAYDTKVFQRSIDGLNKLNLQVFVIGARSVFTESVVRLYERSVLSSKSSSLKPYIYKIKHLPKVKDYNFKLKDNFLDNERVSFIDINETICGLKCPAFYKNDLMYIDRSHLSLSGVKFLSFSKEFQELHSKLLSSDQ